MNHTHNTLEFVDAIGKSVRFWGTPRHEDAGIGHYEYWGFKGYDTRPYISCEWYGIEWDTALYTARENELIARHYRDNQESIEQAIIDKAITEAASYAHQ